MLACRWAWCRLFYASSWCFDADADADYFLRLLSIFATICFWCWCWCWCYIRFLRFSFTCRWCFDLIISVIIDMLLPLLLRCFDDYFAIAFIFSLCTLSTTWLCALLSLFMPLPLFDALMPLFAFCLWMLLSALRCHMMLLHAAAITLRAASLF